MCIKKAHSQKKVLANSKNRVKSEKQIKTKTKKEKNQQFFNSVCKHYIKIEILTLQAVFPDKLFKQHIYTSEISIPMAMRK